MSRRLCPNCGTELAETATACPNCGSEVPTVWPPPPRAFTAPTPAGGSGRLLTGRPWLDVVSGILACWVGLLLLSFIVSLAGMTMMRMAGHFYFGGVFLRGLLPMAIVGVAALALLRPLPFFARGLWIGLGLTIAGIFLMILGLMLAARSGSFD